LADLEASTSRVESICISSPGAATGNPENMPAGRPASDRRVDPEPVVCLPRDKVSNKRYNVRSDGNAPATPALARISPVRQIVNPAVREESSVASPIACRMAATTRSSTRPVGDLCFATL
jgi:hypothetical protein